MSYYLVVADPTESMAEEIAGLEDEMAQDAAHIAAHPELDDALLAGLLSMMDCYRRQEEIGYSFHCNSQTWGLLREVMAATGMAAPSAESAASGAVIPLSAISSNSGALVTAGQCEAALGVAVVVAVPEVLEPLVDDPSVSLTVEQWRKYIASGNWEPTFIDVCDTVLGATTKESRAMDSIANMIAATGAVPITPTPGKDGLMDAMRGLMRFLLSAADHGGFRVW